MEQIPDQDKFFYTYQTIAQVINVVDSTTSFREQGIEVSDVWAMYFNFLESFGKDLSPELFNLLKYSPGGIDTSKSFQSPSNLTFSIDPSRYVPAMMGVREVLIDKYFEITHIDDNLFLDECMTLITEVIEKYISELISRSTGPIVFLFSVALRTILKDTLSVNSATAKMLRDNGIFIISNLVTAWHFRVESQG